MVSKSQSLRVAIWNLRTMTENILSKLNLIILGVRSQQTEWKPYMVVLLLFAIGLTGWKSILQPLVKLEYQKRWIWTEWFLLPMQCETTLRRATTGCANCTKDESTSSCCVMDWSKPWDFINQTFFLKKKYSTFITVYDPMLSSPDEAKIPFYEDHTHTIEKIQRGAFLILMWHFNAWVDRDHVAWHRVWLL